MSAAANSARSASMYRLAGVISCFIILLGAHHSSAAAEDKAVIVFAAASMKNALDQVDAAYSAQTGVKVIASYAASSALAKQIEQGAPADIFLSADTEWMDWLAARKLIAPATRGDLLGNELVLIAAKDSKIGHVDIAPGVDLAKLADGGRIAV